MTDKTAGRRHISANVHREGQHVVVRIEGVGDIEAASGDHAYDAASALVKRELGLEPGSYSLSVNYL